MYEPHSCSYHCKRLKCIERQRDELREKMEQNKLLTDSNALDAAYTSAALYDSQQENAHLKKVLAELVAQVKEEVECFRTMASLLKTFDKAEEALGLHDSEQYDEPR